MFRMGGSTGTGITSGLDKPRQQYNQAGRVLPYNMAEVPAKNTNTGAQ